MLRSKDENIKKRYGDFKTIKKNADLRFKEVSKELNS